MALIGYSTGAVALGDFARALSVLEPYSFEAVELSALRMSEVEPLVQALSSINLRKYAYVSFHAPSSFAARDEQHLIELLSALPTEWPIILHPDAVHDVSLWTCLSDRLAIENMDRRKGIGRTESELTSFFKLLPNAKMCFDLGHARQVDSSMIGAFKMLRSFAFRIVQLHVSEVDTLNRHDVISEAAAIAFGQIKPFIPSEAAIILESRVTVDQLLSEVEKVESILGVRPRVGESHLHFVTA